jgi:hypothetical protein
MPRPPIRAPAALGPLRAIALRDNVGHTVADVDLGGDVRIGLCHGKDNALPFYGYAEAQRITDSPLSSKN